MSTEFFRVNNNSLNYPKYPWAQSIVAGLVDMAECPDCESPQSYCADNLQIVLARSRRTREWPDTFGCGAEPLFIVSERVLEAWHEEGIGDFPAGRITILEPLPSKLRGTKPPPYYWLDGKKMQGARLDFDASGFVDVWFCPTCGCRSDDISATYDRQHSEVWPYTFIEGSWTGANLFTTDLSSAAFFCTERVVECATKHRHTNFRFVPVSEGDAIGSKGIVYLR